VPYHFTAKSSLQKELDLSTSPSSSASIVAALGHSVGEISALYAGGVLQLEAAAKLLAVRGSAMDVASKQSKMPTGMTAIFPVSIEEVRSAIQFELRRSPPGSIAVAANINSSSQVVLSGHLSTMNAVIDRLQAKSRLRAVPLNVSAPFHSPIMLPAVQSIAAALGPGNSVMNSRLSTHVIQNAFGTQEWAQNFLSSYDCSDTEVEREVSGAVSLADLCSGMAEYFGIKTPPVLPDCESELLTFTKPQIPVYSNVTALPHTNEVSIGVLLALQAIAPVQWQASMLHAIKAPENERCIKVFVELGPGSTLKALGEKIVKAETEFEGQMPIVFCSIGSAQALSQLISRAEKCPKGLSNSSVWCNS
jgi:malonyl CoA-acyl carrier protein transacylase